MRLFTAILLLAPLASAQFYIRDQQYRFQADQPECREYGFCAYEEHRFGDHHDFSLNFIEVKGDGTFFDQRQLDSALDQIEKASFKDPATGEPRQKPLVFIYIHGWHNNAEERENSASAACPNLTGDVAKFRDCGLPILASDYPTKEGAPPAVVGIYLAWHGTDFTPAGVVTYIVPSYMLRRYAANHVGQTGMCNAVGQILDKAKDRQKYVVALMGHSFGARVLENALQVIAPNGKCADNPLMRYRQRIAKITGQPDTPALSPDVVNATAPADLIFYINAAAPNTFTRKTINAWNSSCPKGGVTDYAICSANPFYVSVTSHTDFATGLVMPIANIAFFWWPVSLKPPNFEITPLSAANTPWMHTHHDPKDLKAHPCPPAKPNAVCFPVQIASKGPSVYIENYDIEPLRDKKYLFWIMNLGHYFSRNHGDVWNPKIFSMVHALLQHNDNYIRARRQNLAGAP